MREKPRFDPGLEGFPQSVPIFEDLPQGDLARELVEEALGASAPRLDDGRWAIAAHVSGVRIFAAGGDDLWAILRPVDSDEADATHAASKLHAAIGSRHSEWDSDR